MKVDRKGNVYLAEKGVLVYDPSSKRLGMITLPEQPANLCFIDGERGLFITAQTGVYTVALALADAEASPAHGAKAAARPCSGKVVYGQF